jgi:tetratricopeptide (TPR) repeat protein
MTDFFVSYTQADRPWAEWIGWVLEEGGYSTTIQDWDFRPGSHFVESMHRAALECERTMVVLSPSYQDSHFGTMEWASALARKKRLLPVRVREVEPAGLLAGIVYIDLVGDDAEAARRKLLGGVQETRVKPGSEPSFPGERRPLSRTRVSTLGMGLPVRMPFAANPLFVGRRDELRALACSLKEDEIIAITGIGGIGKTQLAAEFVHRFGGGFAGGVFWMSFAEADAVPAEVAACGRGLDLHPSYDALPLDQQVRLVEAAWARPIPRLLVFDNCEDERLLDRWRPRFGGSRVLVTSRRGRWDRVLGVRTVALTTLPRPASRELLRRFRPDLPVGEPALSRALSGIAAELGDLPLALHLAGSFLERYSRAPFGQPSAYLESLRRGGLEHPSLQGKAAGISPTGHADHVARTFALSFERLDPRDETDALAIALLARAAHLAPGEPIPRELLLGTVEDDLQSEDALARLTALGLLDQTEAGALVMHRLVAEFALGVGGGAEARAARSAIEEGLLTEAHRVNQSGYPAALVVWQPHLRAVAERARLREDGRAALLCNELAFHLQMIGDSLGALPFYERALAIRENLLGPEHPGTASSLNNIGGLFQDQWDAALARRYYERALAIREKVLGPEHPDTAQSLNNLGFLLWSVDDFAGARPYYERALAIREKALGPGHPDHPEHSGHSRDLARSLNNLGCLLFSLGDHAAARPLYERALAMRERVLEPPGHPDTARSLNNLGFLLASQGDPAAARPYYARALAILEARLGATHPYTKLARENFEATGA